jgi:hypothetical protein
VWIFQTFAAIAIFSLRPLRETNFRLGKVINSKVAIGLKILSG